VPGYYLEIDCSPYSLKLYLSQSSSHLILLLLVLHLSSSLDHPSDDYFITWGFSAIVFYGVGLSAPCPTLLLFLGLRPARNEHFRSRSSSRLIQYYIILTAETPLLNNIILDSYVCLLKYVFILFLPEHGFKGRQSR
jgi:hypothetical protein